MKWVGLLCTLFVSTLLAGGVNMAPDSLLGNSFKTYTYDFSETGFRATLVHYAPDADSATVADSAMPRKAMVLYIHGFNDYFFQYELAQRMDSAGYSFYAIDLHHYGRSYRKGETLGELYDIAEYYPELDSAIATMRTIEGDTLPLVLMGHSTGGLIACLYAADRNSGSGIAAIVLNSPFLEMNYPWPVRRLAVPVLSALGGVFPTIGVPRSHNENYDLSLHQYGVGEWNYSLDLKIRGSLPINLGWLRAIHQGHVRVQQGMQLVSPVLVMHSGCSFRDDDWSEEYTYCDGVLDVEHIREFGANLGPSVQLERIEGGLHDLFLSPKPVRENAYGKMFKFLESRL